MLRTLQISVDEQGNLLLPSTIQDQIHLTPGTTLIVEDDAEGALRLRVQNKDSVLAEKEGVVVARVKAWGDLSDIVRQERDRRALDLLQRVGL